jgi:HK97 gp10 family phage protein
MAEFSRIQGLKELGEALKALPKEISGKSGGPLLKALRKMAKRIQDDAKARVPVGTGTLRDNIITARLRKDKLRPGEEGVEVTVRYKAKKYKDNARNRRLGRIGGEYKDNGPLFYAKFLEFGTQKMSDRPFLTPAFESAKPRMGEEFREELTKAIDAAVRKLAK